MKIRTPQSEPLTILRGSWDVTDTYRTTTYNKRRIDHIAQNTGRSRSWVINKGLEIGLTLIEGHTLSFRKRF